jgi:hypothetical protein
MTHSPVLVTEMPPSPSERAFYEGLLVSLGSVMPYGVAVNHLRHRFRVLARQMDVRMLIIDEINTMLAGPQPAPSQNQVHFFGEVSERRPWG